MAQTEVERLLDEGKSMYKVTNKATGESHYETAAPVISKDTSNAVTAAAATGNVAYRDAAGQYYTGPSMTFSEGRITINVPKSMADNSEWLKENFTNNDTFKAIASAYKADPTGATGLQMTDKDGNTTERTVESLLSDYQKAFNEYATQYRNIQETRDYVKNTTNSGINLNDNDVLVYLHGTSRDKNKYSDDVPVYLPDFAFSFFDFSKLGSYNADDKTISAKDFYEWYNLDDGTPNKDQLITRLTDGMAYSLAGYQKWEKSSEDEDIDDAARANQYARTASFYRTLTNDNPEANVLTSTRLFVTSWANSLIDNLYTSTGNMVQFVSDFANFLDEADDYIVPLKIATLPAKALVNVGRGFKDAAYWTGSSIAGIKNPVSEQTKAELAEVSLIGMIGNTLMDGDPSELFDYLEKSSGIDQKATVQQNRDTVHSLLLDAHNDMARLSSAATAGSILGGVTAEVLKQVFVTNAIGAAAAAPVAAIGSGAIEGASLASTYGPIIFGMATTEDLTMGAKMIATAMSAKQMAGAVKAAAFTTNIVAQGISDTILNDSDALHKMFMEGEGGDAVQAVGMNTLFNGIGELSGLATTNGWNAIKATQTGQIVEAFEQRAINRAAAVKHRALGRLAETMNKITGNAEGTKIGGQKFNTAYHYEVADAAKNIADAAKLAEPGETITQATKRLVTDRVNLEVAYNRLSRYSARTVLELQTDARVAKYYADTQKAAQNIVKLENGAGLKEGGKVLFTQETTDYIVKSNRVEYLLAKGGEDLKGLTKAETQYLGDLQKQVSAFELSASQELKDAIAEYVSKVKAYQYRFNNLLVSEGVLDSVTLKEQRATGFWGKDGQNYMFSQALKESETNVEAAKWAINNVSSGENYRIKFDMDEYAYKPGDADVHYMDPQLAIYSQQIAAGKVIDGRNWGDALLKTQITAKQIDVDGKPVTTSELKKLRREIQLSTEKTLRAMRTDEMYKMYDFGILYEQNENIAGKILKKQERVAKLLKLDDSMKNSIALDIDGDGIEYLSGRFDIPEYGTVASRAELDTLYANATAGQRQAIDQAMGTGRLTVKNYNDAINNSDLAERLTANYIADSENIMKSKTFEKYATSVREQQLTARQQTTLNKYYKTIEDLQKQANLMEVGSDEFTKTISRFTEDLVENVSASLKGNKFFEESLQQYIDAGINKKEAIRYLALDNIRDSIGKSQFNQFLNKNLNNLDTAGNLTTKQRARYTKAIREAIQSNTDSEWRSAVKVMQKNGAAELVDTTKVFDDIYKLMDDFIENNVKTPNVIRVMTREGEFQLYEVSPVTAYLYNSRPNFSNVKSNVLVKFFNQTNRLFRLMTTGYGLSSFGNQWMRDPLNAYVMGGMNRGINKNVEKIGKLLGEDTVASIQKELGEEGWGNLLEAAGKEATGAEALAATVKKQAELLYGDTSPETQYYREMATGRRESLLGDYEKPVGKMEKAMEALESHSLGNTREIYLRKGVYTQAYKDSLALGKTTKEAKALAELTADNATTDFSRSFAWGSTITSSVPYLGAAINGSASFWRLLEIDPLGVSGRFISGLAIPQMALAAQSLQGEANRKAYMSVPEYVKQDNLVFAADGQVFKIPIPQELSAFLQPFRYVVEKAMDGTDETWSELMLNNLLSITPIDLTGFSDLDDPLDKDADFFSRLSSEGETLISQLAPVIVKTAYMAITGRDPYTQSPIDRSKMYLDSEGNLQIMDSTDNGFAQWVSSTLKNFGINLSPSSAEALLSQFFGQAGIDLTGAIEKLFTGDPVGALSVYGKQVAKPFTPSSYDQVETAWKEVVKEKQAEKAELMRPDGELVKINNAIGATSDPEKLKNLRKQYREIVQKYQDGVLDVVQKFNSIYGANYDWKKYTSTLQLLSFYSTAQDLTTEDAKADAQQLYFDAQNKAKQTMADMGFNGTNDLSIFGYLHTNEYGENEVRATLPTSILNMEGIFYQAKDETAARVISTIEKVKDVDGKTLKDKYKEMSKKESEYYNTKNYNALKKLYKDWDVEVMTQIYPIIAENNLQDNYGNDLLDNKDFIHQIGQYIRVPSDFMGKGQYISSSSGLDKQEGYKKAYIQYLYKQLGGK